MKKLYGVIILCLLLFVTTASCEHQGNEEMQDTEKAPVQTTIQSVFMQSTEQKQTEGAEDAPFVPMMLKHTVTPLTDSVPKMVGDRVHESERGLGYSNTAVYDGCLWVYSPQNDDGEDDPRMVPLCPETTQGTHEAIPVPMVNGLVPRYVDLLDDRRLGVVTEVINFGQSVYDIHAYLVTTDGTVTAEIPFHADFEIDSHFAANHRFYFDYAEDGQIIVLVASSEKFVCYMCAPETGEVVRGRITYNGDGMLTFSFGTAIFMGNQRYLSQQPLAYSKCLDMKNATINGASLRLSDAENGKYLTWGADGAYYLYDDLGIYRYNNGLSPQKMIDFSDCAFLFDTYDDCLWVVDAHTVYIAKTEEVLKKTVQSLYLVQSEKIPDTDTRKTIRMTSYGNERWLNEAVVRFNAAHTDYKVDLQLINTIDRDAAEISAELQEKMLYESHPDMLFLQQRDVSLELYYEKDVFLDLSDYIGDRLLGCVRSAFSFGDALYTIPTAFQLETFLCTAETSSGFVTWDAFFDIINNLEEGEVLTSDQNVRDLIFNNGILDFFDVQTQTATYDSALFCRMVEYLSEMNRHVDPNVGKIVMQSRGTYGYSNITLPARLRDGGIKFLDVWFDNAEMIATIGLLFGDTAYTWCGYPSTECGSAYLNPHSRVAIFADTEVSDGCAAFLAYLLSDEMQNADTHSYLPVTDSGMRAALENCRYLYYTDTALEAIGNAEAIPEMPSIVLKGDTVGYINMSPVAVSAVPLDTEADLPQGTVFDPATQTVRVLSYKMVEYDDAAQMAFLSYLNNCHMKAGTDDTVLEIVEEELSFWEGGVTPIADAAKKIQSRVQIYLNE